MRNGIYLGETCVSVPSRIVLRTVRGTAHIVAAMRTFTSLGCVAAIVSVPMKIVLDSVGPSSSFYSSHERLNGGQYEDM